MMKTASLLQSVRLGRGAFVLTLALSVVPVLSVVFAQELLPELAAPAAQHKAAEAALDKQKSEAIALTAKSYVSALDSIEKAATDKGDLDLVAAVVKEREAVASGTLEPDIPAALPKAKLQLSRKTLLASVERINADFAKRKKAADADYLRVLATLQTKAAANPELAKQISAEKATLLDGGSNGSQATQKSRGKNVVVNGNFEKIVDGKPEGWKETEGLTVVTEGKNTFVRFDGATMSHYPKQEIELPNDAHTVTISARMRTKDRVGSKAPRVGIRFDNQEGDPLSHLWTEYHDKNTSWNTFQTTGPVPKMTGKAFVQFSNGPFLTQYDFDDIEVTFK